MMKTAGNTVLITGGATGIGFSLAEHLLKAGNEVIICGRRREKLAEAKARLPRIRTKRCDLSRDSQRRILHDWVTSRFRDINVLVNNAGIQRMIDLKKGERDLLGGEDEIETNLKACIQLSTCFVPDLLRRKEAAIINISSGLAFVPLAIMPVYCATKAALHSFSLSLRHQLQETPVKVFEIIPPMVDTELDGGARESRGEQYRGIPPCEVAAATMKAFENDEFETAVGQARDLRRAVSSGNESRVFQRMNSR
jgi:uncharacterized oxidoreductase